MEEYHLKYHDDVYTDRRGVLLPYTRLMGMCCWMGSHFHNWIDYNGVAFSIELLEWGRTFSDFGGLGSSSYLRLANVRTRLFVL